MMARNCGLSEVFAVSGWAFGASVSGPRHFVSRRRDACVGGDRFAWSVETGSRMGARGCPWREW